MTDLTRRDLLTTFLGAPFAALACRTRAPQLPPGTLAGASHEVGHRLRGNELLLDVELMRSVLTSSLECRALSPAHSRRRAESPALQGER